MFWFYSLLGQSEERDVGLEDGRWKRRKVARFTALRRERYLEVLGLTGNKTAAAEEIGISRSRMDNLRRRDPAFAADCEAALAAASGRLEGSDSAFDDGYDPDFHTIRRCRNGRSMLIAVGPGRWSKAVEDRFIAILGHCGNIEASARAVGFAGTDMFRRKRQWPGFARRWEEALEEAEERLEFRLACWGNNVPPGEAEGLAEEAAKAVPFDPEFALKFLKFREEKRRGGGGGGGRRGLIVKPEPPIEEVRDEVLRRLAAMRRQREREGGAGGGEAG